MDELVETSQDDPMAMLHPSGKFVVPIMHVKARQARKQEYPNGSPNIDGESDGMKEVPQEMSCPLCNGLLRDAVVTVCCGDSFCDECVQQKILETQRCPGVSCGLPISTDGVVRNQKMRQAVQKFLTSHLVGGSGGAATSSVTGPFKHDANTPLLVSCLHTLGD